jgi:hypothetical protein
VKIETPAIPYQRKCSHPSVRLGINSGTEKEENDREK